MEDQEPTAWEDINPAARHVSSLPAVPSSRAALPVRLNDIHDLEPVDRAEFFAEVGPCLTLAAGVGMSQPDQDAWLEAAFIALDGIPIGLLRRGVKAAMLSADHPSKIVPAIAAEAEADWKWRRENPRPSARPEGGYPWENSAIDPDKPICTPEEARNILKELGIPSLFNGRG